MRPEADPMGITREGGSAPGLWEAVSIQPAAWTRRGSE